MTALEQLVDYSKLPEVMLAQQMLNIKKTTVFLFIIDDISFVEHIQRLQVYGYRCVFILADPSFALRDMERFLKAYPYSSNSVVVCVVLKEPLRWVDDSLLYSLNTYYSMFYPAAPFYFFLDEEAAFDAYLRFSVRMKCSCFYSLFYFYVFIDMLIKKRRLFDTLRFFNHISKTFGTDLLKFSYDKKDIYGLNLEKDFFYNFFYCKKTNFFFDMFDNKNIMSGEKSVDGIIINKKITSSFYKEGFFLGFYYDFFFNYLFNFFIFLNNFYIKINNKQKVNLVL